MNNEKNIFSRDRVFNAVFLVGIFMSFSSTFINIFLGLGVAETLLTFVCGVISVGLYIFFKVSKNYELLSLIVVLFLSFVFFPAMWFVSGGTYSSMPYFMILNAGIISLLLIGKKRKIILSLFAVVVSILMFVEYNNPEMVANYESPLVRYIDLAFCLFICLICIAFLIAALIDSYLEELKKSRQYLSELEEKNKEIEAKNKMLEKSHAEIIEAKERAEELNKMLFEEKHKLKILSMTDYLTGAFNKRFITSYLIGEIETAQKEHKKLTVAMIDVDNFKVINDTYGHIYGDYVLKRVVSTIRSNLRQKDILGRFGGDEFFIILHDTSKDDGYEMMERIRKKILAMEWEHDMVVTISGGVIEVGSDELINLLKKVDQLLYRAKNRNKNVIEKELAAYSGE